ncbi:GM23806 [Drosophila sechellia]|uniref:GM23806 n=1 Tax=Drosophila sechellia TaxID=7238 RepID=B4HKD6_DROSE|nr:GM23806 [Drosophila sechellia]
MCLCIYSDVHELSLSLIAIDSCTSMCVHEWQHQ